jgi:hypothetical protein
VWYNNKIMAIRRWVPSPTFDTISDCEKSGWRLIEDVEGLDAYFSRFSEEDRDSRLGEIALRGRESDVTVLFLPNGIFMGAEQTKEKAETGESLSRWMVLPVAAVYNGNVTPGS